MASGRIKGITIKIGADTTELSKALKDFDKQISSAKTSMKDINKLLKGDPKNTELLTQKQKAFTDAIDGTKKKLEEEKNALKQLEGAEQTDQVVKQQENLKREIIYTEQELNNLEAEYREFGSVAQQQAKAAAEAMQATGKKLQEAGQSIANVGSSMTRYVTAPIVAAGTAVVKTAGDFDAGMSKVQAISGATADDMDRMREKAKEMAANTKFDLNDVADAFSYMGMAGWKTEQMLEGLDGIMYLAAASGEDLATTSDIVTDALTAFGYAAEDAARFSDILAAAATNSNTNVSMMGESFKYAAAPAGALGYTAEDVALALGLMANNGIKADMAGTSLRNLFNRMAKPTKESQMAIDQLGLALYDGEGKMYSFRDVMQQIRDGFKNVKMSAEDFDAAVAQLDADLEAGNITQKKYDSEIAQLTEQAFGAEEAEKARAAAMLGGTRAMSGLLAIAQTSDEDFNKLASAIDNSSDSFARLEDGSVVPLSEALASGATIIEEYNGQAQAMAATMENNLNGDITKLKSQLNVLAYEFGKLLIPEVREFVASLQAVVTKINEMDEGDKQAIINFAKFAAAIGPVLLIVGKLTIGIGKFIEALGTIKGLFAAGGAFANVGAAFGQIGTAFQSGIASIGTGISEVMAGVGGTILTACATIASSVISFFAGAEVGKVVGALIFPDDMELYAEYQGITGTVQMLIDTLDAMWYQLSELFSAWWEYQKGIIESVKTFLAETWTNIKTNVSENFEAIKTIVTVCWDYIKQTVSDRVTGMFDDIKNTFLNMVNFVTEIITKAKTWGSELIGNIKKGIDDGIKGLKDSVNNAGNAIKARLHFSEPDEGPLSDFNSWMPDMMKQMAEQIEAGTPMVASAIQGTASAMRGGLGGGIDYSEQLSSINNGIGQLAAAGGGNITVPVYIGQTKFAQAVVNANQSNVYRSGGR